jgi:allophanate hydrolase
VPRPTELEFFGDELSARAYAAALVQLERIGGQRVEVDFAPFRQAAELLYGGPWIAERQAAVGEYIAEGKAGLDPVVQAVINGSPRFGAVEAFRGQYRLRQLSRQIAPMWQRVDVLVVPTVPTTYSHAEVAADPIGLNSRLGIYTNFTNLLDLCGVAVPTGFKAHGRPFGVTLLAPAFADRAVASLGSRLHGAAPAGVGATAIPVLAPPAGFPRPPASRAIAPRPVPRVAQSVRVAVVGAHLSGQPLHRELVELGARFEQRTRSASSYRLFVLPNSTPPKPGLIRASTGGAPIELEVYALDAIAFGDFVARIAAPLGIGNVQLESGEWVKGFLCEAIASEGATEITQLGGWRAYLDRQR